MNKERLEAFTDAIIAIAATIMVLQLATPEENTLESFLEQRDVIVAYVVSFFMIYAVWYSHHNLFQHAKNITTRIYLINGIWIFFLTLVPFTTAWVGKSANATLPEFLYALNLLLWSVTFHWMYYQVRKDNPEILQEASTRALDRIILYVGYSICMIISFVYPNIGVYIVGVSAVIILFRIFTIKTHKGPAKKLVEMNTKRD